PRLEPAQEQDDGLALESMSAQERRGAWRWAEAVVDAVGNDRETLGRHAELLGRLADREPAADDDALDRTHHRALDEAVERARIEMVVVRYDRHVEPIAPAGNQRRGPDVAQRVRAEQVERLCVPRALDRRGHHERRDRPPEPAPDGQPADRPVRHVFRIALVAREQDLDRHAADAEVTEDLALLGPGARRRLRIDPAMRRADPHVCPPRATTSSMYGSTRRTR